jgi:hypothetical protein
MKLGACSGESAEFPHATETGAHAGFEHETHTTKKRLVHCQDKATNDTSVHSAVTYVFNFTEHSFLNCTSRIEKWLTAK